MLFICDTYVILKLYLSNSYDYPMLYGIHLATDNQIKQPYNNERN